MGGNMVNREPAHINRTRMLPTGQSGIWHRRWLQNAWVRLALLIVGLLTIRHAYLWWISPEHRIAQFLAAARRDDPAAMLALGDRAEIERIGLTPQKLRAVLRDASRLPGGVLPSEPKSVRYGEPQRDYNRAVLVTLRGTDGRILPGARDGSPSAIILAYRSKNGWKIGISSYISSVILVREGSVIRGGHYARLFGRYSLAPELYVPEDDTWMHIPMPEGQSR